MLSPPAAPGALARPHLEVLLTILPGLAWVTLLRRARRVVPIPVTGIALAPT
jgi:hypothetical protein